MGDLERRERRAVPRMAAGRTSSKDVTRARGRPCAAPMVRHGRPPNVLARRCAVGTDARTCPWGAVGPGLQGSVERYRRLGRLAFRREMLLLAGHVFHMRTLVQCRSLRGLVATACREMRAVAGFACLHLGRPGIWSDQHKPCAYWSKSTSNRAVPAGEVTPCGDRLPPEPWAMNKPFRARRHPAHCRGGASARSTGSLALMDARPLSVSSCKRQRWSASSF
jgi:hypothetical protein